MTFRHDAFSRNGLAGAGSSNATGPVGGNTLGFQNKNQQPAAAMMPLVPAVKPATLTAGMGMPQAPVPQLMPKLASNLDGLVMKMRAAKFPQGTDRSNGTSTQPSLFPTPDIKATVPGLEEDDDAESSEMAFKSAKSVANDSDKLPHWKGTLSKLRIRVRNDNGDLEHQESARFNDAIREGIKTANVTNELVLTFINTAGDKLTKQACETAIQILPDGEEKTQLTAFTKTAFWGSAMRLGKSMGPAVTRGGGMGGLGSARGMLNTAGNMALGSVGMGGAGYGVDTLTGMAGMDTNFGEMGAVMGAGAGIPGVRNMLLRGARHLDGKGIASTPYANGPFNQFTAHNITKGNKGVVSGLVKNVLDPWRIAGGITPGKYTKDIGGRAETMLESANKYFNPARNWGSLSTASKGGRILGGVGAVGLASESVAKPLMGYNPLKPAEAGKYHAMKALDQKAQEYGYASAAEFEKSPLGAGMKAYGKDGLLAAASAAWNAMPPEQRNQLIATVGGGTALLGALAAGATGNYGLAAGLGAAGAAGVGYGMLGPRTGFQQLQAATPETQQLINSGVNQRFTADQWAQMNRPQQDTIIQQLMQQATGQGGQNELARAGGE